ncbi:MAG: hypothetical protein WCD18_24120, partial [Thermosynechococcaceae cyanobacterium]
MLFFIAAFFFVSVSYLIVRQYALTRWRRTHCPLCGYTLFRIKRTATDRIWATILRIPIKRYECEHHRCHWQGRSTLAIRPAEEGETLQQTQLLPSNPSGKFGSKIIGSDKVKQEDLSQSLYSSLSQNNFILNYHPVV